jgi:hypothetical protein
VLVLPRRGLPRGASVGQQQQHAVGRPKRFLFLRRTPQAVLRLLVLLLLLLRRGAALLLLLVRPLLLLALLRLLLRRGAALLRLRLLFPWLRQQAALGAHEVALQKAEGRPLQHLSRVWRF